jgi:hypothetical protein
MTMLLHYVCTESMNKIIIIIIIIYLILKNCFLNNKLGPTILQ